MKKPKNYQGFAWDNCNKGYNKKYIKSKKGKKEARKCKKRNEKYKKHYKKYGWDPTETWNLDQTISFFILPRLIYFKNNLHGYPNKLTEKKWNRILNMIIYSIKHSSEGYKNLTTDKKEWKRVQKGFKFFGKYFSDLWD